MFDQSEALPSNYGYAGEDASQLSSLASGSGTLPSSYGEVKDAPSSAPAKKSLSEYAAASQAKEETAAAALLRGMSEAVQQSGVFKGSGKASTPAPVEDAAPEGSSSKWKLYASLGAATLLVGGAIWYFTRNRET